MSQEYGKRATDKSMSTYTFVVEVKQMYEVLISAESEEQAESMAEHWYLNGKQLSDETKAYFISKQPYAVPALDVEPDAYKINTQVRF